MIAALAACGRLGYEPVDGDFVVPDGGGADAPLPGADIRVTDAPGGSQRPSLVWTGQSLVVVWEDLRDDLAGGDGDLYLTRLSASGAKQIDDVSIVDAAGTSGYATAVWNGGTVAVVWEDFRNGNTEIYFARYGVDGARVGAEVRVTDTAAESYDPSIVWTGSEYGVAYDEGGPTAGEVILLRVAADGSVVSAGLRSSDPRRSARASVAWDGGEYGVAWEDGRSGRNKAYFGLVGNDGAADGPEIALNVAPGESLGMSLVWNGSEYGLAWEDTRSGTSAIYFTRLDGIGSRLMPDTQVSSGSGAAHAASLIWTGREYGLAWEQAHAVRFARLDAGGAVVAGPRTISGPDADADAPSLAWNGTAFAVAWEDGRHGDAEIYAQVFAP